MAEKINQRQEKLKNQNLGFGEKKETEKENEQWRNQRKKWMNKKHRNREGGRGGETTIEDKEDDGKT